MENKDDENIEKLVKKMFAITPLESPSVDFTKTVMSEVLASEKSQSLIYKPIFSRGTWSIIFTGIIALFVYVFYNSKTPTASFNINFAFFKFDKLENIFKNFQISSLTGYVLLIAILIILLQTFLLKKYFDKKFGG